MKFLSISWPFQRKKPPLATACALVTLLAIFQAKADLFPQIQDSACLADYGGKFVNCKAKDTKVSRLLNIKNLDGSTPVECSPGEEVTFLADIEITTTASERYGYTVWLPKGSFSPKEENASNRCSVLIGDANTAPGEEIDGDACADISKSNSNGTHLYVEEELTITCVDADGSDKADFNYCISWENNEYGECTATEPTPAGTPSKCRCDSFDVDIFIRPEAPTITKTLVGVSQYDEPGGEFTFNISFTNASETSSLFIDSLNDLVDLGQDGTFESNLDLWGATTTITDSTPDGVYLTASDCPSGSPYELAPEATYSCQIKVHVVGITVSPNPEIYDDVIKAVFKDKNNSNVGDGSSCPAGLSATAGDNCSGIQTVQINDLTPIISVVKTVNPDSITETSDGTNVDYTVTITNERYTDETETVELFEDVDITEILDAVAPVNTTTYPAGTPLTGDSDCEVGTTLAPGESCDFTYTMNLTGNNGDMISNQVVVKAEDDETNEVMSSDTAVVTFTDSPGEILLDKTANPTSVTESGADVIFTFDITNTSAVDALTLTELTDTQFGVIFDSSEYNNSNEDLGEDPPDTCNLYGTVLQPGESVSCTIKEFLSGEPTTPHVNVGTVKANTDDQITCPAEATPPCFQEVMDDDDATVNFNNEPADTSLEVNIAATIFITVTNNSDYEAVNLTKLQFLGLDVEARTETNYRLFNDGGTFDSESYPACTQPSAIAPESIEANGSYTCAFTIELIDNGTVANNPLRSIIDGGSGGISIEAVDPEGGPADTESLKATVYLVNTP